MRLILSVLVTLAIATTVGGVVLHHVQLHQEAVQREFARSELNRFQAQIHLQAALASTSDDPVLVARAIDPDWFKDDRPTNPLVGPGHPWVEVADESQRNLLHPPDPTVTNATAASFWYNPFKGIVRARVPAGISDARAVRLYNEVNDCALESLFTRP